MKWLKVFAVFFVLHLLGWGGAHWYKKDRPERILIVADTSFALKSHFPDMQRWIEDYASDDRYREIFVGTDKAFIGELSKIKSNDSIFRVSFGRSNTDSLKRYESRQMDKRIFLSDGEVSPPNWTLVEFP